MSHVFLRIQKFLQPNPRSIWWTTWICHLIVPTSSRHPKNRVFFVVFGAAAPKKLLHWEVYGGVDCLMMMMMMMRGAGDWFRRQWDLTRLRVGSRRDGGCSPCVFFWRNDKGMTYNGQSFLRLWFDVASLGCSAFDFYMFAGHCTFWVTANDDFVGLATHVER